jgi:hypothetical protein
VEQTVHELRAAHLDVVGELEAALEGTAGDAAIEVAAFLLAVLDLAGHDQGVLLGGDRQIVGREAGNRHTDAIGVLIQRFDVVRGVATRLIVAQGRIHQPADAVEADGGTEKGGKVESRHGPYPP